MKMTYDARFVVNDDLAHRLFEIANLVGLAATVVHIRPVSILSNPSKYIETFAMCLSLSFSWLLHTLRHLEIALWAKGERQVLSNMGWKEAKVSLVGFGFCLAATIIAGKDHFSYRRKLDNYGDDAAGDEYAGRWLADLEPEDADYLSGGNSTYGDDYESSSYATKSVSNSTTDAPIWLILAAPISFYVLFFIRFVILFPNDGTHKQYSTS